MTERWVRTDEVEDVAGSIRHALHTAQLVGTDSQAWKWVCLALHSALQGACVCHLTSSAAPLWAVTERNAGEWLAYFEESRTNSQAKRPKTYLMALPDLLKAVRKANSAGDRCNETGVEISDAELEWLCRFHENIRNQFVHFEPMGWSVEVSGIPAIAALTARVIGEIDLIGYAFRHQKRGQRDELRKNLAALISMTWPA